MGDAKPKKARSTGTTGTTGTFSALRAGAGERSTTQGDGVVEGQSSSLRKGSGSSGSSGDQLPRRFQHLASTTAEPTHCRHCGAPILTALDTGFTARVDAHPILPSVELVVLLSGRRTYTHTHGRQLVQRTAARITANYPRGPLHAEHVCKRR